MAKLDEEVKHMSLELLGILTFSSAKGRRIIVATGEDKRQNAHEEREPRNQECG